MSPTWLTLLKDLYLANRYLWKTQPRPHMNYTYIVHSKSKHAFTTQGTSFCRVFSDLSGYLLNRQMLPNLIRTSLHCTILVVLCGTAATRVNHAQIKCLSCKTLPSCPNLKLSYECGGEKACFLSRLFPYNQKCQTTFNWTIIWTRTSYPGLWGHNWLI